MVGCSAALACDYCFGLAIEVLCLDSGLLACSPPSRLGFLIACFHFPSNYCFSFCCLLLAVFSTSDIFQRAILCHAPEYQTDRAVIFATLQIYILQTKDYIRDYRGHGKGLTDLCAGF